MPDFMENERDWEAEWDADTLKSAREIMGDPSRMARAKSRLREKAREAMQAADDLETMGSPLEDGFVVLGRLSDGE